MVEAHLMIGQPIRRKEDPHLLQGGGRFVHDLTSPGLVHLAFVRSPYAHAVVRGIDLTRARRLPGVVAVLAAADLPLRPIKAEFAGDEYHGAGWPALAGERVRFVGDPVAVVAASDRYLAEDAVELIEVAYDPLPVVASVEEARRPDAVLVHDTVPGNVYFRRDHAHGDVDGIFATAALVVGGTFRHQRLAGAPLEGRGIVAQWDSTGRLTVWASTQVPHLMRTGLARFLGVPEAVVRVIVPDVGGGFGPKMHLYPEDLVACAVARTLGRPTKWIEDRRENLLAMTQAREQVIEAHVAADRDGRLLALRAHITCDSGAYSVYPVTAGLEPMGTAQIMPGPYHLPAYAYSTMAVATHKAPVGAYRGVGMTVGVFVMERLVDKVAIATRIDPAEVRRRNFIRADEFPYTAPSGLVYDSGRLGDTLAAALAAVDYEGSRHEQARLRAAGRIIGVGLAAFVEYTGMGSQTFLRRGMREIRGDDSAAVKVDGSGGIRAYVSTPSQGQGHETTFAQLVGETLGLSAGDVQVVPVDTDVVSVGTGTFASRAMVAGGGALLQAAAGVRSKALQIAAHLLEASAQDIEIAGGRFCVRGSPDRGVTWAEVARAAYLPGSGLPANVEPGLEASATYDPPPAVFSNGVHAAMVEVDRETGQVTVHRYAVAEDCGPLINPRIVDGQIHGGLAQGFGEALLEQVVYDAEGQPLTTTFMDYLLPTAKEMPPVTIVHLETPSPLTTGGFKGMGESATIGAPACLANAVSDALGDATDELPITPERVLVRLRRKRPGSERP
jgi:carbon-monoxide dehydrogenase large subunit